MPIHAMPEQLSLLDAMEHGPAAVKPTADWQVRVSKRARTIKIQVFPHGGVEVVVPRRTHPNEVQDFVLAHRDWIARTRAEFMQRRPPEALLPQTLHLRALEEVWAVRYRQASGRARLSATGSQELLVTTPDNVPQVVWPLLREWLKARGRQALPDQVARLADSMGLSPRRVQVRLQRTRWGSCSATGTVSLNAALLLRPPAQMRYVVIHELCHLRHLNHSRRFWRLVERYVPDYRELDAALDRAWETAPNWLIG